MFEACKVVQCPFNQEIQELDWEMYIKETVAQIVLTHLTICQSRANHTMIAPTPPGYVIDTEDIAVMFVSGHQSVFGWHNAEYVIGWKRVMQMILCVFEDKNKMDDILSTLHKLLKDWAKENWMGRGKEVIVDLSNENAVLEDDTVKRAAETCQSNENQRKAAKSNETQRKAAKSNEKQ